jgi:hypothetical protein
LFPVEVAICGYKIAPPPMGEKRRAIWRMDCLNEEGEAELEARLQSDQAVCA